MDNRVSIAQKVQIYNKSTIKVILFYIIEKLFQKTIFSSLY